MIFQAEYFGALAIGFFGSLHCLGMCGPIALFTPAAFPGALGRIIGGLIYNGGRVLTYMLLGAFAGSIGKTFALFKWQQGLSLIIGIFIVTSLFLPGLLKLKWLERTTIAISGKTKAWMGRFLANKSVTGIFGIGLANGLLPCGLVYLGLAGSLDMSNYKEGALFMMFFGLGTIPMMTGLHLMGNNLTKSLKGKLAKLIPFFVFIMGLLFILRGLGLGIPYISPSMDPHSGDIHCTIPAHRHVQ
jgi:sulfite exporter TauE/SafE